MAKTILEVAFYFKTYIIPLTIYTRQVFIHVHKNISCTLTSITFFSQPIIVKMVKYMFLKQMLKPSVCKKDGVASVSA